MTTMIDERVTLARKGENPTVVCRVPSGWVVMSDVQLLRGYCLLLPDPVPASLNDLDEAGRAVFLRDMTITGDALLEVTGAWRINYEILGNSDPALHAHIIPRYISEPEALGRGPVWFYDRESAPHFDPLRDRPLMDALSAAIKKRI